MSAADLSEQGFTSLPGPFAGTDLETACAAYDHVMATAHGPHYRAQAASTTTRMSDVLGFSSAFDALLVWPPLLAMATHFFDQPFKLSSLLARTLKAGAVSQALHSDLPRDSPDAPLLGFILMIDPFCEDNGATRFVPGSHLWPGVPADSMTDTHATRIDEVCSVGEAGTVVVFNAAIWHGHTANRTAYSRRSLQGYFVRRDAKEGFDFRGLAAEAQQRFSPAARYLLALDT